MFPARASLVLVATLAAAPASAQLVDRIVAELAPTIPGEFVVQLDSNLESIATDGLESLGGQVVSHSRRSSVAVIRQPGFESMGMDAAISRLSALPGVRRVEPNFEITRMGVPNDPMADQLWMIEAIELAEAWGVLDDAQPVVVAVIDDGVQTDHEDLAGNLWVNAGEIPGNGVDDDGNGFVDDVNGFDFGENDGDPRPDAACWAGGGDSAHGTHVAGTVGAVGGNGIGVVGAAPKVQIMALKLSEVLDEGGCRYAANGSITAAIDYATLMGADVISMSLGGPRRSQVQRDLLQAATDAGIVVVVAAGNDGLDIDGDQPVMAVLARMQNGQLTPVRRAIAPMYPAAWNLGGQITVAATEDPEGGDPRFVRAWREGIDYTHVVSGLRYTADGGIDTSGAEVSVLNPGQMPIGSNWGPQKVHLAAPGKAILSTIPRLEGQGFAADYATFSGTSMATPAVSGAVAILRAAFPEMTPAEIKARLMATVDRSGSLGERTVAGGEINLFAALCSEGAPRRLPGCDGEGTGTTAGASYTLPGAGQAPATAAATPAPAPQPAPAEAESVKGSINVNELLGAE
ncbi:hypothetical protein LNKW23_17300 [Paralimibaculum aggregatum]|uniref:Peptidase S8/S53 domain-containing protein n=1 Tax=Paralimibaculum aggregatum TaxID=3036245 RepID=A0ABQ6LGU8_9RHOB|nr:S8 family peptidase [Limibaculum sp. NKW23]GMG82517.1 hypothetical protein LNKW23_17300 [Limibaculum sp. NKW23]